VEGVRTTKSWIERRSRSEKDAIMAIRSDKMPKVSEPTSAANEPTKTQTTMMGNDAAMAASHVDEGNLVLPPEERSKRSERIIQDHVLMGLVAGLIPGPGVDLAAGFGIQLAMLARLAKLYGVPFRRDLAKNLVSSLFGSLGAVGAGGIIASSLIKTVPVVGTALGFIGTSGSMGAFTYAVGKLFQQHFESGGTFDDLKPRAYSGYFREMFRRGKTVAAEKAGEAADQAKTGKQTAAAGAAAGA
jgi:uncharacterized protein (DUF697 family)